MLRVCVLEFAVEAEVAINLARAIRLIDAAVQHTQPELIVLPSGLDAGDSYAAADADVLLSHSADPLASAFVRALAQRAVQHGIHLVFGHDASAPGAAQKRSVLLVGPRGELLGSVEGPVLGGPAVRGSAVFATTIGHIGLCVGESFSSFESARLAALEGADLLCASYGPGFLAAEDDHPSARALENAVHVLCAAALFPAGHMHAASARSRIVARDGHMLSAPAALSESILSATLPREREPDANDAGPLALRRPELYRALEGHSSEKTVQTAPRRVSIAAVGLGSARGPAALDHAVAAVRALAHDGVELVVLPALFAQEDGADSSLADAVRWFLPSMRALAEACAGTPTHVITSVIEAHGEGFVHHGVVVGHAGIVARRVPSHLGSAFQWCEAGRRLETVSLPWGKLGIVLPDELYVPEVASLWARHGADVLAVVELDAAFDRPRVLARQWAREHGMVVALAAPTGASVDGPTFGVELGVPPTLTELEGLSVVVRKVRLGQSDPSPVRRVAAPFQRALWAVPRFTPSLVEAVLSTDPDNFVILHGADTDAAIPAEDREPASAEASMQSEPPSGVPMVNSEPSVEPDALAPAAGSEAAPAAAESE